MKIDMKPFECLDPYFETPLLLLLEPLEHHIYFVNLVGFDSAIAFELWYYLIYISF